jgi:hypothetical protein
VPFISQERPIDALDQQAAVHIRLKAVREFDNLARGHLGVSVGAL